VESKKHPFTKKLTKYFQKEPFREKNSQKDLISVFEKIYSRSSKNEGRKNLMKKLPGFEKIDCTVYRFISKF
jgi:hypothetical protein